jgi:hypothetical protein
MDKIQLEQGFDLKNLSTLNPLNFKLNIMDSNDLKNPVWRNLVLKKKQVDLNFLPVKILLSRWQMSIKNESSQESIEQAVKEIFQLYLKNEDLPNAKKDISLLLNK